MALFFILEFQKSNTEIRYHEVLNCEICNEGEKYSATTTVISDDKIVFELGEGDIQEESFVYALFQVGKQEKVACKLKLYVKKKQCYKYKSQTRNQCSEEDVPCYVPCKVSCRDLYECEIMEMTQEEQDMWNGFLHNRIPTMPQTVSGSRHIWEDLKVNIQARCSSK